MENLAVVVDKDDFLFTMVRSGVEGKVNSSEDSYRLIEAYARLRIMPRGKIHAKNKEQIYVEWAG